MNIRSWNWNLLPVLDALLAEKSVTRAARRLGMTQPAVSNALGQLRVLLADPILVRVGPRMVPTERALALSEPLARALEGLGAALSEPAKFEPRSLERTFTLATTDYVCFVLLPKLLAALEREAPGVRIRISSWPHHRVPPGLERGEADLMLGFHTSLPSGHRQAELFEDHFVCVVRRGHPRVKQRLTLRKYVSLGHLLVTQEPDSRGVVDDALEKLGLKREVRLRVPHFLMAPAVVASTDLVAALDERVARPFAKLFPLALHPAPLSIPGGRVRVVWHERTDTSAPHRYLRDLIQRISAEL
ncbi:MAG: LysR family transcriptional regulator [Polyangiaceae bacterium]